MKNVLLNLLIFFALGLCGMIAFQWTRETDLRKDVQKLTDIIHDKSEAIQNLTGQIKRDEAEIQRLDSANKLLNQTVRSNDVQILSLQHDLAKVTSEAEKNEKQAEAYKDAFQKANDNVLRQNEEIKRANEDIKKVVEDRSAVVLQLKEMAAKYKDLAEQWNKQQEELRLAAATNAPPKK
jgi:chromosome segregation ATPase